MEITAVETTALHLPTDRLVGDQRLDVTEVRRASTK
jgi:hypothetical protein